MRTTSKFSSFDRFGKITLASASERRSALLRQLGWKFEVCPSRIPEPEVSENFPEDSVKKIALLKARSVAEKVGSGLIIGADTVVLVGGKILGKPTDPAEAIEFLERLSGNFHEVITGVALVDLDRNSEISLSEKTTVHFRNLSRSEILAYVKTGEANDKAGAYGIQGRAAAFVRRIEGCYFNVVGLPLAALSELVT